MPTRRTYGDLGDACRAANALDLVGDRWTLIVVREVILGPKRFADLQEAVRGITPAVLTERLRLLQDAGIVEQVVLPGPARARAYAATEWGRGLGGVLEALGRWYSAGPDPGTAGGMTPDAMVLAMRTMAPAVPGAVPVLALRLYDGRRPDPPVHDYRVSAGGGRLDVRAGAAPGPAATVTAEATAWSAVLFDGLPLADAERDGAVRVEGDRAAVARVVRLFSAPAG
ncbi:winged helix-turn-helix transcriptional regulator [Spirilliplanes yamanashiensis]|uniref:Transcriptional regulator n=1 Tax=Spirilliplanes yamanashiensis TaxID=42233 RepID=A0A8J3YDS4_9ACTN|nr:helix-turn-helix domain-containing protein [Spirilliplanes yamanashiensis]MDP9816435.1 DNA-binding HxlR family transcriptional regulator [Spirilliplanes yamanashiensis]GIJ05962.1 transcriptional regulator [Spirilliplanes yamanashiensis]